MDRDSVARIEIDTAGRLHVVPSSHEFPFIYRAGKEVGWDPQRRSLHSPNPRECTYTWWFEQILAAVSEEYGCNLVVTESTQWINIDPGTKAGLVSIVGTGA